jgi:hypothetical protein
LFEKLQAVHAQYEEEKGRQGLLCGEEARLRLIQKNKEEEEKF